MTLQDLIKYSLGYLRLVNPARSRLNVKTPSLKPGILSVDDLLRQGDGEEDLTGSRFKLDLELFYTTLPKNVEALSEEEQEEYEYQREIASALEEIRRKYELSEYTKQVNLNLGFVSIELPDMEAVETDDEEGTKKKPEKLQALFTLPVKINFTANRYEIELLDSALTPNIGFLSAVVGDDIYSDILDRINQLETDGAFALPVNKQKLVQVWEEIAARLKLVEGVKFGEDSFTLDEFLIALAAKSNFFMTQDLSALAEMDDEMLLETALSAWVSPEGLQEVDPIDGDSPELFFPFPYDKYQVKVLSVINNKASIVQGPPGTGKSQTIANVLTHLAANKKKVLFLSQKDQALRVVKDSLKSLNIDYLFGYIPDSSSRNYNKEEEKDGAAFALGGLQQYLSYASLQRAKEDTLSNDFVKERDEFDEQVNLQREYYSLKEKLDELERYKFSPRDCERFLSEATDEWLANVLEWAQYQHKMRKSAGEIVGDIAHLDNLERRFAAVDFLDKEYSDEMKPIVHLVSEKAADRGFFQKAVGNTLLLQKVSSMTRSLPREVDDFVKEVVRGGLSRDEMRVSLENLTRFLDYKEFLAADKEAEEHIQLRLVEAGLSEDNWQELKNITRLRAIEVAKVREYVEAENTLSTLHSENPNEIGRIIHSIKQTNSERVKNYIRNRIREHLLELGSNVTVKAIVARIARALQKSKRAYKTFDKMKSDSANFEALLEVVPIWIMSLEDVSRLIPLQPHLFDYIIIDEASQCNLAYTLPAMFRSEHVVFFGDTLQMRDDSIRFKSNESLQSLARKHKLPSHMQIKGEGDAVKSVMDIGILNGFQEVVLQYHYRSPKELIGFSNEYFYAPRRRNLEVVNTNYLPYEDTQRVLVNHYVKPQKDLDTSDRTNRAEALYIKKLISRLRQDPLTAGKSIGVLTFFNDQALELKNVIDDDSIKISAIEGIQGDERDIIIYSFVITDPGQKKRYIALTGEGGEVNKELNEGRVNVAFSRAKQQVHAVFSLPIEEWPDGIWIDKYLKYVEENGRANFLSTKLKPFDSGFEEHVYGWLYGAFDNSFIIQNQVESCGFKIDLVVTDTKTGKKLAIECDGPTHFTDEDPDTYVQSDWERQSILEAAKWVFYRIPYQDWDEGEVRRAEMLDEIKEYFKSKPQVAKPVADEEDEVRPEPSKHPVMVDVSSQKPSAPNGMAVCKLCGKDYPKKMLMRGGVCVYCKLGNTMNGPAIEAYIKQKGLDSEAEEASPGTVQKLNTVDASEFRKYLKERQQAGLPIIYRYHSERRSNKDDVWRVAPRFTFNATHFWAKTDLGSICYRIDRVLEFSYEEKPSAKVKA